MTKLLILKTGSTVPAVLARRGDFERWITAGMGVPETDATVVSVYRGEPLPPPAEVAATVVTGSAALVTDREPWSERTTAWLAEAARGRTAILGICYGHQLLAHALGGEVANNPRGRQIGTVDVTPTPAAADDGIFGNLQKTPHIPVSHVQSVCRLPDGAQLLATTAGDPHHAFRIGDRIWGMQCHPEFDADIVRGYIRARQDVIRGEGLDPEALSAAAKDTPDGDLLLRRFFQLLEG